jgi:short-subunit dehydrogenase
VNRTIPRESISHSAIPSVLWWLLLLCACLQLLGCATAPAARTNRDRVVVLLGASSGFGKGVALELADQGANVVVAARRTQLLEELARECEQRGGQALAVTADATKEADVERLAQEAVSRFGRIDVWINLAGIGAFGRFEEIPLADHHRLVDVNINGVINGSYYAMRQFRRQGAGTLINISSVAGRVGFPYYPTYSASKHAVTGLGVALNQELRLNGDRNIHVSTIEPYASNTPWFEHAANYLGHSPSMVLMDPPPKIVDAIVRATLRPKKEIAVGYKAKLLFASHRMTRRVTENAAGRITHNVLMKQPPTPPHSGSLQEPMASGTEVEGPVPPPPGEGNPPTKPPEELPPG